MKKVLYILLKVIGLLAVALAFYTTSYFCIKILPVKSKIDEKITAYKNWDANVAIMRKMAVHEEGEDGIASYVAHSLALEYLGDGHFRNFWHLVGLHWQVWIPLIYDDEEVFSIWLALAPYGNGRGMNEAAVKYFSAPIPKLGCNQLATLTVMVRSPSGFPPGGEASRNRIETHHLTNICS
jgi:hypothetical protein